MTKQEVAAILNEIGELLELAGENPFRARSYYGAARAVERLAGELGDALDREDAEALPGVGAGLARKIRELWREGSLAELEELRARIPAGVREMVRVPGLGPKKIRQLHETLGIRDLAGLRAACEENRLVELPGFGPRTQENILAGLGRLEHYQGRFLLSEAIPVAETVRAAIAASGVVSRVVLAGETRRWLETVTAVELVAAAPAGAAGAASAAAALLGRLGGLAGAREILAGGADEIALRLDPGIPVRVRLVAEEAFAAALALRSASEEHVASLQTRAAERGLRLTEQGLFRGERRVALAEEEDLYRALDLPCPPPELRETPAEGLSAGAQAAVRSLLTRADLRGMMHVHSDYSDGTATIAEMARAAAARGYAYLGIADHSRSAAYAGGLEIERVLAQRAEIERLNRDGSLIPILAGIESDILPDGSLDYPEEILAGFDFVVASVHSRFRLGRAEMTARVVRAIASPHVHILGHPTGRLLLERDPYEIDLAEVLAACAREGVAVELNAHPQRLDLDWREIPQARRLGVTVAVNPDAHRPEGMDDMEYGVAIARKGGLTAAEVLNARDLAGARAFFRDRRERASSGRES